jgi:hypothetical protein
MMQSNPSQNISSNPEEATRLLYKNWREKFAMPLLIGALISGIFVLIPAVDSAGSPILKALFITTYILLGIVTVLRFSYTIRISVFLLNAYALGLGELLRYGILGDGTFFFLGLIIFATLLLSPRAGIGVMVMAILTTVVTGWLMLTETIAPLAPFTPPAIVQDVWSDHHPGFPTP